jgi:hypothetical protein
VLKSDSSSSRQSTAACSSGSGDRLRSSGAQLAQRSYDGDEAADEWFVELLEKYDEKVEVTEVQEIDPATDEPVARSAEQRS